MNFDIILVTYNSSRHIGRCFKALEQVEYPLENLHLIVVDNGSTDDTLHQLKTIHDSRVFPHFKIIESKENLGFGRGNNLGVGEGTSELVFFLNIDTEILPDALGALEDEIRSSTPEWASFELRQLPYEHPKVYDPLTLETSWSSGAAVVVRRDAFLKVGGFDPRIFMYAEDVDLSWKLRRLGLRLKYVPKAATVHHSYENPGQIKPLQYYNSLLNNLLLRFRYGRLMDILKGKLLILVQVLKPSAFPGSKGKLFALTLKRTPVYLGAFLKRLIPGGGKGFRPTFRGFDYEDIREGAFHVSTRVEQGPLVSVLVRTIGRPEVLAECLASIQRQTYGNIETIVVEDGPPFSQEMIQERFPGMRITYASTGEKVGRCKAANLALELAKGDMLNFLDDDDLFYGDHVETLVAESIKEPGYGVYYSLAFEVQTEYRSLSPLSYVEHRRISFLNQPFNKVKLAFENLLPIQAGMFRRTVLEKAGGFDETIGTLEDWDFWIRLAAVGDFRRVEKTTSLFRTPWGKAARENREAEINRAKERIFEKNRNLPWNLTWEEARTAYLDGIRYRSIARDENLKANHPFLYKGIVRGVALLKKIIRF